MKQVVTPGPLGLWWDLVQVRSGVVACDVEGSLVPRRRELVLVAQGVGVGGAGSWCCWCKELVSVWYWGQR